MAAISLKDGQDATMKADVIDKSDDGKRVCLGNVMAKRKGHDKFKPVGKSHCWVRKPKGAKIGDKLVASVEKYSYDSGKLGLRICVVHATGAYHGRRHHATTGRGRGGGRRRRRNH